MQKLNQVGPNGNVDVVQEDADRGGIVFKLRRLNLWFKVQACFPCPAKWLRPFG
jgi:hypothetical protein